MWKRRTVAQSGQPIVLVESNPTDEESTVGALRKAGIANEVIVARSGTEAVNLLLAPNRSRPPALVLLELSLTDMLGIDLLERLRADPRTQRTPVVIFTSSKREEDKLQSYRQGANSFVLKPGEPNAYAKVVAQLGQFWLIANCAPRGS